MHRQLLTIEDHALFRAGLVTALSSLHDLDISEAVSVEAALKLPIVPTLILLDIQLSGMSGLDGMTRLRQQWPDANIILISAHDSYANAQAALKCGAIAFLSKSDTTKTILATVTNALAQDPTNRTISPLIQTRLTNTPKLSDRQLEVMQLLAQGFSNKTIGRMLSISENTIRWHVCTIISALQVSSRTEAVFVARKLGLLN